MAEEFDPYHKWLGIPADEQPPNHYRLLGIELFESDHEVIDSAADQRMSHLKTYQTSKNARDSQNLLTGVAKAKVCLLNPSEKTDYDRELRLSLTLKTSDSNSSPPIPASRTPRSTEIFDSGPSIRTIQISDEDSLVTDYKRINRRNKKLLFAVFGLLTCLIAIFGYAYLRPKQNLGDAIPVAETDQDDKTGSKKSETEDPKKNADSDSLDHTSTTTQPATKTGTAPSKDSGSNDGAEEEQKNPPPSSDPENDTLPDSGSETGNPAIVISKKKNDTKTVDRIERAPVPDESIWRPFESLLRREFEIRDDLKDQQRYVLFNELSSLAKTESHPGRAYAMFNLAVDQAKITCNTNGHSFYTSEINKRFFYENAEQDFLLSISTDLRNNLDLIVWLEAATKLIQKQTENSKWASSIVLLKKIIEITSGPLGRKIDANFYRSWLEAIERLAKISNQFESELNPKLTAGQLSDKQQIDVGIYFCFVKRDVSRGLSHFANSNSKPLVELAKMGKKSPNDPTELLPIAEKWLNVSVKVGDAKFLFRDQAKEIYNRYEQAVPAGQHSKKTTKRIEELNPTIGGAANSLPRSVSRLKFSARIQTIDITSNIIGKIHVNALSGNSISISGEDGFQLFDMESGRLLNSNYLQRKTFYPVQAFRGSDNSSLLATLEPRRGLRITDIDLRLGKKKQSPFQRILADTTMRAFDIGDDFTVYALTLNDIKRWSPQGAWQKSTPGKPETLPIVTSFIPNRIEAISNSGYALSDSRNLARISASQKAIELYSGEALYDYDFPQNGSAVILSSKGSINYRLLKGNLKRTITTQSDAKKIKFIDGSRFAVSLHVDGSCRAWDVNEKSENYLLDSLQVADFKPIDFSITRDRRAIVLVDKNASLRKINLFYE